MPDPTPERECVRNCQDWSWPRLPVMIAWRCDAWPDLGECTNDRRPCTSPRRHQCRSGLMAHDYSVKYEWRMRQSKRFYAMWTDCCQLPF